MYVYDGPLFWALSNAANLFALVMIGAIVLLLLTLNRHWSWAGLAYAVLGVVFCLLLAAGGYALVSF